MVQHEVKERTLETRPTPDVTQAIRIEKATPTTGFDGSRRPDFMLSEIVSSVHRAPIAVPRKQPGMPVVQRHRAPRDPGSYYQDSDASDWDQRHFSDINYCEMRSEMTSRGSTQSSPPSHVPLRVEALRLKEPSPSTKPPSAKKRSTLMAGTSMLSSPQSSSTRCSLTSTFSSSLGSRTELFSTWEGVARHQNQQGLIPSPPAFQNLFSPTIDTSHDADVESDASRHPFPQKNIVRNFLHKSSAERKAEDSDYQRIATKSRSNGSNLRSSLPPQRMAFGPSATVEDQPFESTFRNEETTISALRKTPQTGEASACFVFDGQLLDTEEDSQVFHFRRQNKDESMSGSVKSQASSIHPKVNNDLRMNRRDNRSIPHTAEHPYSIKASQPQINTTTDSYHPSLSSIDSPLRHSDEKQLGHRRSSECSHNRRQSYRTPPSLAFKAALVCRSQASPGFLSDSVPEAPTSSSRRTDMPRTEASSQSITYNAQPLPLQDFNSRRKAQRTATRASSCASSILPATPSSVPSERQQRRSSSVSVYSASNIHRSQRCMRADNYPDISNPSNRHYSTRRVSLPNDAQPTSAEIRRFQKNISATQPLPSTPALACNRRVNPNQRSDPRLVDRARASRSAVSANRSDISRKLSRGSSAPQRHRAVHSQSSGRRISRDNRGRTEMNGGRRNSRRRSLESQPQERKMLAKIGRFLANLFLLIVVGRVKVPAPPSDNTAPEVLPFPWLLCNRCLPGNCMRTRDSRHYWSQVLVWSTLGGLLFVAIVSVVTVFFVYCNSSDGGPILPEGPLRHIASRYLRQ